MNKILPIILIGILVISALGATAIETKENKISIMSEKLEITFTPLQITEYNEEYIEINFEDITTYLSDPGKPRLPKVVNSFELPLGVKNVKVEVTPKNIKEYEIQGIIRPAPYHLPLTSSSETITETAEKNIKIYSNHNPYPESWYSYRVGVGLNENMERVTHVDVQTYPTRYKPADDTLLITENAEIKITYQPGTLDIKTCAEEYDMVIIAPKIFSRPLNKLVQHKNNFGIKTLLETTESIYNAFEGRDKPEQIKYFIKYALDEYNVKYVLLFGGLKSKIFNIPREHRNYGVKWWHVPVRYNNFYDDPLHPLSYEKIYDPGVLCDLYYADIYGEGEVFQDWDPNEDGIIAAWGMNTKGYDVENDTCIDYVPDLALGRLACRNLLEARQVINKIIRYEETAADPSWFNKMVTISGDGFMDLEDLDFQWDTNSLEEGEYTIKAQSYNEVEAGVIDKIKITIDRSVLTVLTFNHDDHLRITEYPCGPIAEIVSVSDGDILGATDYYYEPKEGEAYGNSVIPWANLNFTDGILHIRGKTYDPRPYGVLTDIHVWVENEDAEVVFDDWRYNQEMYYEGEWVVGQKLLLGGGGAGYYMPENFEIEDIWASNGELTGPADMINALNGGSGFVFFSGHGSPNVWSDHYPGIPGNRRHGSIPSLSVISMKPRKLPIIPTFPMRQIKNKDKLPIILIGGCHNSQFNVSMIPGLLDLHNNKFTWCHGSPVPECFSWYLVKMPHTGAIATIGNTGLGYGVPAKECTTEGLDGGICIEFFKQYGEEYETNDGATILGDIYAKTLVSYYNTFDMEFLDHAKTYTQWVLLGDPSLMIGGYS